MSSLTNIIDTHNKCKLSMFAAFIYFRKAYDLINRDKLWSRLNAIKSIYNSVRLYMRLNCFNTEWFPVPCGLRQ